MSYKNQIDRLQEKLIREIKFAVEDAKGCIGTYYKNKGHHFDKSPEQEQNIEYETAPVVITQSAWFDTPGNYGGTYIYDLFLKNKGKTLYCTLKCEHGEQVDKPLKKLRVEDLLSIYDWLVQHNFITELPEQILYCGHCGGTNVEILAWVSPNQNNEYANDFTQDNDEDDRYCNACQNHIELYTKPNLMGLIDDWFARLKELPTLEKAAGLKSSDYDDRQAFLNACRMLWQELPDDEKIERWRARADDDPEQD